MKRPKPAPPPVVKKKRCPSCEYAPGGAKQLPCQQHCRSCRYNGSWGCGPCSAHGAAPYDHRNPLGKKWYARYYTGLQRDGERFALDNPPPEPAAAEPPPARPAKAKTAPSFAPAKPPSLAKVRETPPPAKDARTRGPGVEGFGVAITALLRWMGRAGFDRKEAGRVCKALGRDDVAEATYTAQMRSGSSGKDHHGPVPALTREQERKLLTLAGRKPAAPPEKRKDRGTPAHHVPEKLVRKEKVSGTDRNSRKDVGRPTGGRGRGDDAVVKRTDLRGRSDGRRKPR